MLTWRDRPAQFVYDSPLMRGSATNPGSGGERAVRARSSAAVFCVGVAFALCGCKWFSGDAEPEATRDPITGLTPAEDREVLAKVGEKTITLGDYARTVARMDEFERLRYQTPERQAELLDELINTELLAQEAERRGLDKSPEYQAKLFLALRDERLEELRASLPPLESFSDAEVGAYYEAHKSEFEEPERRRPLVIVTGGRAQAETVLRRAKGASGSEWGKLAKEFSLDRRGLVSDEASELAGDLGFVSAPGVERGENPEVPEPVRAAVFQLQALGDVAPEVVEANGRFYVVRLGGTSPARLRSRQEADRTIRVELRRRLFREKEKALLEELRKKYPATVDRAALERALESASDPAAPSTKQP